MIQLLWFKRDLRLLDHQALAQAARAGPVLPLYVIEPELWQQPDSSLRQWQFVAEALRDLHGALARLGQPLLIVEGEITAVLARLCQRWPIAALHSHEETGNGWSYRRDRAVARWCRERGIVWHQYPQFGVKRPLANRDHWLAWREAWVAQPLARPPAQLATLSAAPWPEALLRQPRGFDQRPTPGRQHGGSKAAQGIWQDFLSQRVTGYRGGISSPLTAPRACSRLSPYLAWGCISLRQLQQQARLAAAEAEGRHAAGLEAFISRLYWHCHFIQKLEDEPELEQRSLHPGLADLYPPQPDPARLAALQAAQTGIPFVDACLRWLDHSGWLNFRMRAMVMSVSSYLLWLPWQQPAWFLARQFTDYEPGIHYPQVQMQSGTTGINPNRIYNPVRQGQQWDSDGRFIRHWLPELAALPDAWLHQPWLLDRASQQRLGVVLERDYPAPLVVPEQAMREARARISAHIARLPDYRAQRQQVGQRHGSRQRRQPIPAPSAQLGFDF